MAILRNLDLVVLGIALPVFIATGWPLLGWGTATAAWVASRVIQTLAERRTARSGDRKVALGMRAVSLVGRLYLVGGTILVTGIIERKAGLAAGILSVAVFTVWFISLLVTSSLEEGRS